MNPARRLLIALAVWSLLGLAVSLGWLAVTIWLAAGGALLLAGIVDGFALWLAPPAEVQRTLPRALALGRKSTVGLRVGWRGKWRCRIRVQDHYPGDWPEWEMPRTLTLSPGRDARLDYQVRPVERGLAVFGRCALRVLSPAGLWFRQYRAGAEERVRVYPDFSPLARFALVNAERAGRAAGAQLQRRRGQGTDFRQLREFRVGDSLRQVDWKATARHRRPISREYQDEREQQVVILLDTGHHMLAHDDELSHFDHVLNAALVLSYIAVRQGDSVGLLAAGSPPLWLPPRRGQAAIRNLMDGVYDLQARPAATDYRSLATELATRQRRRALVVMLSNLRDEDSEDMGAALQMLMRRHLVCLASLRESALDRALDSPTEDLKGALMGSGAAHYLAARKRTHDRMRQRGATVLDVNCDRLPAALTDTYLAIKRAGRL